MASPRTNFEAPSIAPKKELSSSSSRRRRWASLSSIRPRRQIRVDRHLLAGDGVEREARADFGDTRRALGDHDEIDRDQDREDDQADDEVAAHDELGEAGDDVAGRVLALAAARQDQRASSPRSARAAESSRSAARSERPRNRADAGSTARPSGSAPTARSRRQGRGRSGTCGIGRNRIVSMATIPTAKTDVRADPTLGLAGLAANVSAMRSPAAWSWPALCRAKLTRGWRPAAPTDQNPCSIRE